MDVNWRHYYLDSAGNVKKKKKNFLPKYLRRAKSFTANSTISFASSSAANTNSNIFRGWNRSAYFRSKIKSILFSRNFCHIFVNVITLLWETETFSENINHNEFLPCRYTDLTWVKHKHSLQYALNHESLDFFRGF